MGFSSQLYRQFRGCASKESAIATGAAMQGNFEKSWKAGVKIAYGTDSGVSKHGTIEAGKYADIIAVDGSPLEDISALLDVNFVMKGGKVYKK